MGGCFALGFDAVFGFTAGRFAAGLGALAGFFTGFDFLAAGAAFFDLPFLAAALMGLRGLAVEDFFFAGAGRVLEGFLPLLALKDFFFAISKGLVGRVAAKGRGMIFPCKSASVADPIFAAPQSDPLRHGAVAQLVRAHDS